MRKQPKKKMILSQNMNRCFWAFPTDVKTKTTLLHCGDIYQDPLLAIGVRVMFYFKEVHSALLDLQGAG